MGLFDLISNSAKLHNSVSGVTNSRKAIFAVRDALRGTPQFSALFYAVVGDVQHPPRFIEATQSGIFSSEVWNTDLGGYEPYKTVKIEDKNIGYTEGCAVFLLIQECYPNVYDFPSNTMAAIQNGAVIQLKMRQQFLGRKLIPAVTPPAVPASPTGAAFCSNCGQKIASGAAFCSGCGNKLG